FDFGRLAEPGRLARLWLAAADGPRTRSPSIEFGALRFGRACQPGQIGFPDALAHGKIAAIDDPTALTAARNSLRLLLHRRRRVAMVPSFLTEGMFLWRAEPCRVACGWYALPRCCSPRQDVRPVRSCCPGSARAASRRSFPVRSIKWLRACRLLWASSTSSWPSTRRMTTR